MVKMAHNRTEHTCDNELKTDYSIRTLMIPNDTKCTGKMHI